MTQQKINRKRKAEIAELRKGKVSRLQGVVTDTSPLKVSVGGGASVAAWALESAGPLSEGDRVQVDVWRHNRLVIGKATDDPQGTGGGGGAPSGPAGGVLSGTYPDPGFAADMATQAELDANATADRARANHTGAQAISTVSGLQTAIDAKAPLASPTFTGTPQITTTPTIGDYSHKVTDTAFVQEAVSPLASALILLPPVTAVVEQTEVSGASFNSGTGVMEDAGIIHDSDGITLTGGEEFWLIDQIGVSWEYAGLWYCVDNGVVSGTWQIARRNDADDATEVRAGIAAQVTDGEYEGSTLYISARQEPFTLNSSWVTVDSLISGAPEGTAGGDLTGTYPNPTIASSVLSTFGRSLVNDADAASALATLGLTGQGSIWVPPSAGAVSAISPTANALYFARVHIPAGSDAITGVEFRPVNATGSVKAFLADASGTQIRTSGGTALTGSGFGVKQQVAFASTYTPTAGFYWIGLAFNNASSSFLSQSAIRGGNKTTAYTTPGNITPATDVGTIPWMWTY